MSNSSKIRMRRLRRLRKRGVIAVLPFELHDDDVDAFLRRGLLRPDEERDRNALAQAVCDAFEAWLDRRIV
jgi:hypothetical protein